MLRNFSTAKVRPSRPTRACRTSAGPWLVHRMTKAMASSNGTSSTRASSAMPRSSAALTTSDGDPCTGDAGRPTPAAGSTVEPDCSSQNMIPRCAPTRSARQMRPPCASARRECSVEQMTRHVYRVRSRPATRDRVLPKQLRRCAWFVAGQGSSQGRIRGGRSEEIANRRPSPERPTIRVLYSVRCTRWVGPGRKTRAGTANYKTRGRRCLCPLCRPECPRCRYRRDLAITLRSGSL